MYREFLKAKDDFLAAASRTYESRIQTGTGGNLSVRIPGTDLMIVKPSGFSYGQCSEENITITDFQGNLQEGLYKHTHSPYSILISLNDRQLELITLHSQLKLKKPVKIVDVTTQAVTQEELPKVFKVLDTEPETAAIILKGHGIVAISSSAVKAGQIAELIEETAMIAWEQKKLRK
mgnify:CR=1 FL=1